ncbi:MAG: hypothetical protein R3F20_09435 [Planctomycetota bacterium]
MTLTSLVIAVLTAFGSPGDRAAAEPVSGGLAERVIEWQVVDSHGVVPSADLGSQLRAVESAAPAERPGAILGLAFLGDPGAREWILALAEGGDFAAAWLGEVGRDEVAERAAGWLALGLLGGAEARRRLTAFLAEARGVDARVYSAALAGLFVAAAEEGEFRDAATRALCDDLAARPGLAPALRDLAAAASPDGRPRDPRFAALAELRRASGSRAWARLGAELEREPAAELVDLGRAARRLVDFGLDDALPGSPSVALVSARRGARASAPVSGRTRLMLAFLAECLPEVRPTVDGLETALGRRRPATCMKMQESSSDGPAFPKKEGD